MFRLFIAATLILTLNASFVFAEQVWLKNGDRITGDIIARDNGSLTLVSPVLGKMTIKMPEVSRVEGQAVVMPETVKVPQVMVKRLLKNTLSASYVSTNGNTRNSRAAVGFKTVYKNDRDEWGIKSTWNYAEDEGKMITQKFYSKAQSDHFFGDDSKWFVMRAVELNHERFNNIDYRLVPSVGPGYRFWNRADSKALLDVSLGYEYTDYRDETKSEGAFILVPHGYWEKEIFGRLKMSEDLTFYPSLEDPADYRIRSETALVRPLSDKLSWKLSYVDEFNASPIGGAKKNDSAFFMSLEYAF